MAEYGGIQDLYNQAILCFSTLFSTTQWTVCFLPYVCSNRVYPQIFISLRKILKYATQETRTLAAATKARKGCQYNYLQPQERGWREWSPFKLAQKLLRTAFRLSRLHHEAEILAGREERRRGCGRQRD